MRPDDYGLAYTLIALAAAVGVALVQVDAAIGHGVLLAALLTSLLLLAVNGLGLLAHLGVLWRATRGRR
jgi:uncharacterized membrane protein